MTGQGLSIPKDDAVSADSAANPASIDGLSREAARCDTLASGSRRKKAATAENSSSSADRAVNIRELKAKLRDEDYMAGAILRIATVLSARLTEGFFDGGRTTR